MTREQLIEKIVEEFMTTDSGDMEGDLTRILNDNLPQLTGVDALVEKYKELHEAEQMVVTTELTPDRRCKICNSKCEEIYCPGCGKKINWIEY